MWCWCCYSHRSYRLSEYIALSFSPSSSAAKDSHVRDDTVIAGMQPTQRETQSEMHTHSSKLHAKNIHRTPQIRRDAPHTIQRRQIDVNHCIRSCRFESLLKNGRIIWKCQAHYEPWQFSIQFPIYAIDNVANETLAKQSHYLAGSTS